MISCSSCAFAASAPVPSLIGAIRGANTISPNRIIVTSRTTGAPSRTAVSAGARGSRRRSFRRRLGRRPAPARAAGSGCVAAGRRFGARAATASTSAGRRSGRRCRGLVVVGHRWASAVEVEDRMVRGIALGARRPARRAVAARRVARLGERSVRTGSGSVARRRPRRACRGGAAASRACPRRS